MCVLVFAIVHPNYAEAGYVPIIIIIIAWWMCANYVCIILMIHFNSIKSTLGLIFFG